MLKNLLLLLLFPLLVFSQKHPKVGLVLSGGGAKGFAHVGVLKELEKAGVQVDYIGGTSMGSIIGGLYAAGYKPDQIEQLIKETDFNTIIQDKIARRKKSYFEKNFVEKHAFTLPLEKGKLHLPLGLSRGQNTLNLLSELLYSVDSINDFSKLPIPFFCVATDIETGDEVILEKGFMPLAIRASSSFPSLLNPVEINGRLLVDGGVVNNFPVDIMKEKGVDIIIGVNVQGGLSKKEDLTSIAEVLIQIINFQLYRETDKQVRMADIHVKPNVTDFSVTSFEDKDEIMDIGVKDAKKYARVFDSIASIQGCMKEMKKVEIKDQKFLIDKIDIKGNKNYSKNYILGKLKLIEGDSVSYRDLSNKVNILSATNNFERVHYHLSKSSRGKKLLLNIIEEKITSFIRLGVHYDQIYNSSILMNYNHKKLLFPNDEIIVDLVLGDNFRYEMQYLIDNGIIPSYGFSTRYNSFNYNLDVNFNDINSLSIDYNDFTTNLYIQTTLDKKAALGFGLEHKNINIKTETVLTNNRTTYFDDSNYINSFAFLRLDTFDKKIFPKDGFFMDFGFKWYMLSDRNKNLNQLSIGSEGFNQFSQIEGTISNAFSLSKKFTAQYTIQGGHTLGVDNSQVFNYQLGGNNLNYINNFRTFYGYEIASLNNDSFLKFAMDFRMEIFKQHYASFMLNYVKTDENAFDLSSLLDNRNSGYAVGYGIESFLGPIELKYSWSPDHDEGYFLFNLGFWF